MPDTYISKKIKKIISDTSEKVNKPLADLKKLNYDLDKSAKQGTLTKADIQSASGQVLQIRKVSYDIDISPVEKVIDTTKTTVTTVKTGKEAAIVAASVMNPAFGPSTIAIEGAKTLVDSAELAVQIGEDEIVNIKAVQQEVGNVVPETIDKIDRFDKYLEENAALHDELFTEEWNELVKDTNAHIFYSQEAKEGVLKRDWVDKDPEKFQLVLDHAKLRGFPLDHFSDQSGDWALNHRVDSEIKINKIVLDWIKDSARWHELNKITIDRLQEISGAEFASDEANRLRALNETDRKEMAALRWNVYDYKKDYDIFEGVMLSLSSTSPKDRLVSGVGSVRSGRITQDEYNTKISQKQKDRLDRSVGILVDLAYNDVYLKSIYVETGKTEGGVETSTVSSTLVQHYAGYEVLMDVFQETTVDGRVENKELLIIINRYGTQVVIG